MAQKNVKWRTPDVEVGENIHFSSMRLSDRVLIGLKKAGFKKPSPIQLDAIPEAKEGKDVIVQGKSGTGKTLIYVIAALENLKRKLFVPQVMIIVPTREMAIQICLAVKSVSAGFRKLTCCSFIGGLPIGDDRDKAPTCQIVVGTPGRLKQLINDKVLPLQGIKLLVLEEADLLLDITFKQKMEDIIKFLPEKKQVIATSATYSAFIVKQLLGILRNPYVAKDSRDLALSGIKHYVRVLEDYLKEVPLFTTKLSILEEIFKAVKFSQCLVFCNNLQMVDVLDGEIADWGFSTVNISSDKKQSDRLKAIDKLKRFKCKVLVTTDVAARGIDAENVDLIINFDLPLDAATYVHRVGRAGRYGSNGVAISIIQKKQKKYLKKLEKAASFKTHKLPGKIKKDLIEKARWQNHNFREPKCTCTPRLKTKSGTENSVAAKNQKHVKLRKPTNVFQGITDESDSDEEIEQSSQDKKASKYSVISESSEESSGLSSSSDSSSFLSEDDSEEEFNSRKTHNKSHRNSGNCNHTQYLMSSRPDYSAPCFLPSDHRCHMPSSHCQMSVCSMWYGTFYKQWQHIQSCVNSEALH